MILYQGKLLEDRFQDEHLDHLCEDCVATLEKGFFPSPDEVVEACDLLYRRVLNGEYENEVRFLLKKTKFSYDRFLETAKMFSKEGLIEKCRIEWGEEMKLRPLSSGTIRKRMPLGILFHIAAGNVDGLPAFSVIEGLLSGNINILKLPSGDSGLSVRLLFELTRIEPRLREFIYVFDIPSVETESLKKMAEIADGVVVWGGDEAASAARALTDVKTKLIVWGHKLSFAYVTAKAKEEDLVSLAEHICRTEQILCSSVQGIYIDSEDFKEIEAFGRRFFEILKIVNAKLGKTDIGMRGRNSIRLYNDRLEEKDELILSDEGVSVVVKRDRELELSCLFRNVWIKGLPREKIISALKKNKGHLQSCALLCGSGERDPLSKALALAGIVRITGTNPSRTFIGEAHDGMYPLKEYSRIVEFDKFEEE